MRLALRRQIEVAKIEIRSLRVGPDEVILVCVEEGQRLGAGSVRVHTHPGRGGVKFAAVSSLRVLLREFVASLPRCLRAPRTRNVRILTVSTAMRPSDGAEPGLDPENSVGTTA